MANFRSVERKKSLRQRECFECGNNIFKNEFYINIQIRYDYRILTVSRCVNCRKAKENTFLNQLNKFKNFNTKKRILNKI